MVRTLALIVYLMLKCIHTLRKLLSFAYRGLKLCVYIDQFRYEWVDLGCSLSHTGQNVKSRKLAKRKKKEVESHVSIMKIYRKFITIFLIIINSPVI